MIKLDYGLEPGGNPEPQGYGEEDVRERAEERARKRIKDATDLYELVDGYEIDIWLCLAEAMYYLNMVGANDTPQLMALAKLKVIHAIVMDKATELEMDAARRELIEADRKRYGKTRYCQEDE